VAHPCLEAARIAKHDLGKYVAFQIRWLPPDAPAAELLEALRADVLQTRRGPDGAEAAHALWRRLRPGLDPLGADPDLLAVDRAVAALEAAAPGLAAGALDGEALAAVADEARAVARHLAALFKRLRAVG
jgi:hypothetical protein